MEMLVKVYDEKDIFVGYSYFSEQFKLFSPFFFVEKVDLVNWVSTEPRRSYEPTNNSVEYYFNLETSLGSIIKKVLFDEETGVGIIIDRVIHDWEWSNYRSTPRFAIYTTFQLPEKIEASVLNHEFEQFFGVKSEVMDNKKRFFKKKEPNKYVYGLLSDKKQKEFRCDISESKLYFEFRGLSPQMRKSVQSVKKFIESLYEREILKEKKILLKVPNDATSEERILNYLGKSTFFHIESINKLSVY